MFRKLFSHKICRRLSILFCSLILFTSSTFASTVTVGGSYTTAGVDSRGNVSYAANRSFVDAMNSLIDSSAHNLSQNMRMLLYTQNTLKPLYDNIYSELYNLRYQFTGDSLNDYQGVNSMLNSINTQAINIYGSTSATNVHLAALRDELKNIEWSSAPWTFQYYTTPSGYRPELNTQISYTTYPRLYIRFGGGTLNGQNLYRVTIPVTAYANDNKNNYIQSVALYRDNVLLTAEDIDFYVAPGTSYVYLYFKTLPQYGFNIAITFKNNYIINSGTPIIQYVPIDTLDYYLVSYLGALNSIKDEVDSSSNDIVDAINNKTIEAELDNSIGNDDIYIDESLPSGGLIDSARVITRLKSQFGTNVSVLDFLNNFNISDLSGWYSTDNANVVQSINSSYTDLYE